MVFSRQIEIRIYRSLGRQHGRGFRALAHVIGRTTAPFFSKGVALAVKRVIFDLLGFSLPENAKFDSGGKKLG